MNVIDPGHEYKLARLDGEGHERLTFLKRDEPADKYPGNVGSHPGTTTQEVLRALIDRMKYVNQQHQHVTNESVLALLRGAVALLELRAAEMRGEVLLLTPFEIELKPVCSVCGHVVCTKHNGESK